MSGKDEFGGAASQVDVSEEYLECVDAARDLLDKIAQLPLAERSMIERALRQHVTPEGPKVELSDAERDALLAGFQPE